MVISSSAFALVPSPPLKDSSLASHCKTCPIYTLNHSLPLTPTWLESSNLVYQLQYKKFNAIYIGETGQMLSKHINGPLTWLWTLTFQYSSIPNSISSLSRNAGPSTSFTNSSPPTMSVTYLKWHTKSYFNPDSLPV